jgi:hypothetical protein
MLEGEKYVTSSWVLETIQMLRGGGWKAPSQHVHPTSMSKLLTTSPKSFSRISIADGESLLVVLMLEQYTEAG